MNELIKANEDEYCCCCQTNNVDLYVFEHLVTGRQGEHKHCKYCYKTFAGNSCIYPAQYDTTNIQILVSCLHIMERDIKDTLLLRQSR